jgi:DNA-directed RNA polymerase subunit RPC12/RpoP
MIDNLEIIKTAGMAEFLKKEDRKWTCKRCHMRLSAHRNNCMFCGAEVILMIEENTY